MSPTLVGELVALGCRSERELIWTSPVELSWALLPTVTVLVDFVVTDALRTVRTIAIGRTLHGGPINACHADEIVKVMAAETFLVLPHATVLDYMRAKTTNYDRWLGGMQKLFLRHHEGGSNT